MTEYHWQQIRDRAIELFAETPSAQLEQDILEEFERRPAHVAALIERIGKKVQAGKIRSGWAVVRKDLTTTEGPDVTATDEAEREKRIRNAERWIEHAGLHYDREQDVEAELFGDDYQRGRLHDYRSDDKLRTELIAYWHEQRPRGEQAERNHEAWAQHCVQSRQRVAAMLAAKRQETECQTTSSSTNSSHSSEQPSPESGPNQTAETTTTTSSRSNSATAEPSPSPPKTPRNTTPGSSSSGPDPDAIPHFTPTPG